jgi:hypothetical protein
MEKKFKKVFINDDDAYSVRSINTEVTGGYKKIAKTPNY